MKHQRVEDLLYVHTNLRLSRKSPQYKKGETRMWDIAGDEFSPIDDDYGILEVSNLSLDEPELESVIFIDEGDLSVVISCASLALADAGIMMYDLVASVSVSCLNKNLVIDPILGEENCEDGGLMITCLPSRYEVTQLTVTGEWSTPMLNEGMQLCLDACAELAKIMRSCLVDAASASEE